MLIEVYKLDLDADTLKQLNDKAISFGLTSEEEHVQILDEFPNVLSAIAEKLDLYVGNNYDKHLVQSWSMNWDKDSEQLHPTHNHGFAHLNFVLYTSKQKNNSPLIIRDINNLEKEIDCETNDLLILPGHVTHYVRNQMCDTNRICYAGDIILTNKYDKQGLSLAPIKYWKQLNNGTTN